ncbi:MAG: hypothetical protein ACPLRR_02365, partial [Candidatus Saccharicenans sp.]
MKTKFRLIFLAIILLLAVVLWLWLLKGPRGQHPSTEVKPSAGEAAASSALDYLLGAEINWPLLFIQNKGQIDPRVAFYLQSRDKNIYFSRDGLTITLSTMKETTTEAAGGRKSETEKPGLPERVAKAGIESGGLAASAGELRRWTIRLDFVGANPETIIKPLDRTEARISYFRGGPEDWFTALPSYRRIAYRQLWPGVDLYLGGQASQLKCEFILAPGTDPATIKLNYRGATSVRVNEKGQLEISTPAGSFL